MPRVAASNGVKPFIRALSVIPLNVPVAPSVINDHVGTGDYASKYVSKLRKVGFVFDCAKDGKTIVSYTLIGEPADAATYRAMQPKAKAAPAAKVAKAAAKVVKAAKEKPAKKEKVKKPKVTETVEKMVEAVTEAAAEAEVKAANLEMIKKVAGSRRRVYPEGRVAVEKNTGVENFDAETAKEELDSFMTELDSFKAPKFLSKDQVKFLI